MNRDKTGLTDLPLTERGERNARRLGDRLKGLTFAKVFTSPLQRARRTCELAGFGAVAEVDQDLVEWDYGQYEGRTSAEIHAERPDWMLFRDGCPGGESVVKASDRADRVVSRLRAVAGNVLVFSSGHFIRGLKRLGRKKWQKRVEAITERLVSILFLDDVVLGGGNAKRLARLPFGCRIGDNANAFVGGFRLWEEKGKQS